MNVTWTNSGNSNSYWVLQYILPYIVSKSNVSISLKYLIEMIILINKTTNICSVVVSINKSEQSNKSVVECRRYKSSIYLYRMKQ